MELYCPGSPLSHGKWSKVAIPRQGVLSLPAQGAAVGRTGQSSVQDQVIGFDEELTSNQVVTVMLGSAKYHVAVHHELGPLKYQQDGSVRPIRRPKDAGGDRGNRGGNSNSLWSELGSKAAKEALIIVCARSNAKLIDWKGDIFENTRNGLIAQGFRPPS
eukprot:gnl/TRDRNA2_/TRDRNA2_156185_c0_seq2.p1 gnl/TRDRNA2_/TRDRNA2_156185_c0~~gnl/TRDRNA2_/TRDRNA2_156185_c0_seq2.p1  ORF type:complete len:160 (-),score=13.89 gnl/TRDRNA2_/TRDRNA2_156185_c0_seq2:209-688(-)